MNNFHLLGGSQETPGLDGPCGKRWRQARKHLGQLVSQDHGVVTGQTQFHQRSLLGATRSSNHVVAAMSTMFKCFISNQKNNMQNWLVVLSQLKNIQYHIWDESIFKIIPNFGWKIEVVLKTTMFSYLISTKSVSLSGPTVLRIDLLIEIDQNLHELLHHPWIFYGRSTDPPEHQRAYNCYNLLELLESKTIYIYYIVST